MPEIDTQQNTRFLAYLESIGLIIPGKLPELEEKFSNQEKRKIIFTLSNYFQNLNASDWFDLSSNLYSIWLANSEQTEQNTSLNSTQKQSRGLEPVVSKFQHTQFSNEKEIARNPLESLNDYHSKEHIQQNGVNERGLTSSSLQNSGSSSQKTDLLTMSQRVEKIFNSMNSLRIRAESKSVRNAFELIKQNALNLSRSIRLTKTAANNSHFEKLYEDHFIQKENQLLRSQFYTLQEMRDLTFSPKINKSTKSNLGFGQTIETPVFDRLIKKKPISEKLRAQSREFKELQGATFSPQINRSRSREEDSGEEDESLALKKERATQRLYEAAINKEKTLRAKRLAKYENELAGLSFSPITNASVSLRSPSSSGKSRDEKRNRLDNSVNRLYSDAGRRERELAYKIELQESEKFSAYTFKPQINRPSSTKAADNAHNRLYGEALKRFETKRQFENEMAAQDKARGGHSFSEKHSQPQHISESKGEKGVVLHSKPPNTLSSGDVQSIKNNERAFEASQRLYEDRHNRLKNLMALEKRVMSERGITFSPKTLSARSRSPVLRVDGLQSSRK